LFEKKVGKRRMLRTTTTQRLAAQAGAPTRQQQRQRQLQRSSRNQLNSGLLSSRRQGAARWVVRAREEEEFDFMKTVGPVLETAGAAVSKLVTLIAEEIEANKQAAAENTITTDVNLPEGVSTPKQTPNLPTLTFGFTSRAERWNSRAAMIGFFSLLFVELIFGKGLLELMGISVGNGLGFEF